MRRESECRKVDIDECFGGERISIATFKAQTTRYRIMGIYNTDDMQIVFSDTPGVLKPNYKLQESMLNFSTSALTDADVLTLHHIVYIKLGCGGNRDNLSLRKQLLPLFDQFDQLLLIRKVYFVDKQQDRNRHRDYP